jgi:hypothetical protein
MPYEQEDADFLRQLIAEARAMKTKPLPGGISLAVNHPGYLSYGVDTPAEYDQDQRNKYILSRLNERYPRTLAGFPSDIQGAVIDYRYGNMPDIDSPYHYRGWFTSGAPLHNVVTSMSSLPAAAYGVSGMLANAVDPKAPWDPNAKKTFDTALNTLSAYKAEDLGLVPQGTKTFADVAEDARHARGAWRGGPIGRDAYNAQVADYATRTGSQTSGYDHWKRSGVPDTPALFLGAATDAVLDPYNGLGRAVRVAKEGKRAHALVELAKEFGFGQAIAAGSAGTKYYME